ncbi:MAG: ribonuclease P protein component [Desulfobulbaceae bacterium]|nr:ribonuclease P protein component [Desulfobulbaceae bacterium]MCK5436368.1 ribonuclease P protein component [Desulfobulbaceae bacterium]MCK5545156.1 ribonuclease P protein component [Desulfobulbaceae bacterium]
MHSTRFSFPKSNLIRKPGEYNRVYRQGNRHRGSHFTLIIAPNNSTENRLGISIHGINGAVKRNRIKRIIREFFRLNRNVFKKRVSSVSYADSETHAAHAPDGGCVGTESSPGMDIVFAIRKGFSIDSPYDVKIAVKSICYKDNFKS